MIENSLKKKKKSYRQIIDNLENEKSEINENKTNIDSKKFRFDKEMQEKIDSLHRETQKLNKDREEYEQNILKYKENEKLLNEKENELKNLKLDFENEKAKFRLDKLALEKERVESRSQGSSTVSNTMSNDDLQIIIKSIMAEEIGSQLRQSESLLMEQINNLKYENENWKNDFEKSNMTLNEKIKTSEESYNSLKNDISNLQDLSDGFTNKFYTVKSDLQELKLKNNELTERFSSVNQLKDSTDSDSYMQLFTKRIESSQEENQNLEKKNIKY